MGLGESSGKPPITSGASLYNDQMLLIRTLIAERAGCSVYDEGLFSAGQSPYGSKAIFNPSCARIGDTIKVIARGERTDATLRGRYITEKAVPLLSEAKLGDKLSFSSLHKPILDGMPSPLRSEDWRLFAFNGELWTNYTTYFAYNEGMPQEEIYCRTCIGRVTDTSIRFVREMQVDEMNRLEKNWAFFEHEGKIKFVKSLEPFVIGTCDENGTVVDLVSKTCMLGRTAIGSFVANSTNPILVELPNWGEVYFMVFHLFAQPYGAKGGTRHRTYFQHAFIFDKNDLSPIAYTRQPFLTGGQGRGRDDNVIYVSGALDSPDVIHLLAGEGDENCRAYGISKELLCRVLMKF